MVCAETVCLGNTRRYSLYSQAGSLLFPRPDFGATWGATGSHNYMGGALWADFYWPTKSCLVYEWHFQGGKTTSYLEYCDTKTSRCKDWRGKKQSVQWFCMLFSL